MRTVSNKKDHNVSIHAPVWGRQPANHKRPLIDFETTGLCKSATAFVEVIFKFMAQIDESYCNG